MTLPAHKVSRIWVPTLTIVLNLDSIVLQNAFAHISGNVVTCFAAVLSDPTAGTLYTYRLSLPVGIEVIATSDIIGSGAIDDQGVGNVMGHIASNEALFSGIFDASARTDRMSFAYRLP